MSSSLPSFSTFSSDSVIETNILSEWLDIQTTSGKDALHQQLQKWSSDPKRLLNMSQRGSAMKRILDKDPSFYVELKSHFTAFSNMEKEMTSLWDSTTELEKESYGELLFLRPWLQPLNTIPYLLTFWSFLRIYFLPGLSFLIPLLTLLAPYFILTYAMCIPITFTNYITILHSMMSGQLSEQTCSTSSSFTPGSLLKQLAVIMVTLIQGVVQPYWTYKHLHSIGGTMEKYGQQLMEFRTRYQIIEERLREHGFRMNRCPLPSFISLPHAVSEAILHPVYFRLALKYIGTLEVFIQLFHREDIYPVNWIESNSPYFSVKDTFDIQVPVEKRKTLSVELKYNKRHALLTGPNKGGKSTILRALSLTALLAHTFGCSIGKLTASPFEAMCVCLKPDDLPGTKSRFEREIEFTAQTLRYRGPVLIFLDELYHSTNPPDALASCIEYSKLLWKMPYTMSIISTHLFDWVEKADPSIQRLCCPAFYDPSGKLQFTYELHEGICRVSSVYMLLEKNGLL